MAQVRCPGCQTGIPLKARHSGRKVKCRCGKVFRMPVVEEEPPVAAYAEPLPSPIQFQCPACLMTLQVKAEVAGKSVRCKCSNVIKVPLGMASVPAGHDPLLDDDLFGDPANFGTPLPRTPPPKPKPKKRRPPRRKPKPQRDDSPGFTMDSEMIGGLLAMVGAVVWFVAGFAAGYIFFYPPILFFIGLASFIKGAMDGD